MAGEFTKAGERLIAQLREALVDEAKSIMRESIQECPISDENTYVPQFRMIGGRLKYLGDDHDMVGDNGTLRRSARVFAPVQEGERIVVEMGYGFGDEVNPVGRLASQYAVAVHERAELHHDPPTKDHYLEDPVLAHAGTFGRSLAIKVRAMGDAFPFEVAHGLTAAEGLDLGAE